MNSKELDIWTREEALQFNYKNIEPFTKELEVLDFYNAYKDSSKEKIGDLQIYREDTGNPSNPFVFYITPDKQAFTINFIELETEFDSLSKFSIENLAEPVVLEDGSYYSLNNEFLWEIEWEENETELKTISLGGKTDFYDKNNWWPHIQTYNKQKNETIWRPLVFLGEILLEEGKGYIFYGVRFYEVREIGLMGEVIGFDDDYAEDTFVLITKNSPMLPPWIHTRKLDPNQPKDNLISNIEKRIIPVHSHYPKTAIGIQYVGVLSAPFDNFLIQIPTDIYGVEQVDENIYKIDSGDYGSLCISSDNKGEYRAFYQQA